MNVLNKDFIHFKQKTIFCYKIDYVFIYNLACDSKIQFQSRKNLEIIFDKDDGEDRFDEDMK